MIKMYEKIPTDVIVNKLNDRTFPLELQIRIHRTPRYQWQAAIDAYRNGTATSEQLQLLEDGHWTAP